MLVQPFDKAADCLKLLAHAQRLRIIALLRKEKMFVGDIAAMLGMQSHVTSEHLRLLQRCGFLSSVRQGRSVAYQIAEPHLLELLQCIESRFGKEKFYEHNKGRRTKISTSVGKGKVIARRKNTT